MRQSYSAGTELKEFRHAQAHKPIRVATVVGALSAALDLSTGQPIGHSLRTCLLGMRIGRELGLEGARLNELYYALLIKDCGCSGNSSMTFHALRSDDLKAKHDVKTTDWTAFGAETIRYALDHVAVGKPFLERVRAILTLAAKQKAHTRTVTKIRCERGATLARLMGLPNGTARAILDLDEHWDGSGNPENLRGEQIDLYARIILPAQTLEVFAAGRSREEAIEVLQERSKRWFDPAVVKAALALAYRGELWNGIEAQDLAQIVLELDSKQAVLQNGDSTLDAICVAFAQIVDAKSPFTYNHSNGVANAAIAIAQQLDLPRERILFVRHAALLHDLGKLGVSNSILEKPGKLNDEDWLKMKAHPADTLRILNPISGFEELSEVAASHHEKLNGKGYFRNYSAAQLSIESRILAVADIFDALAAKRPYRDSLPLETVFKILNKEAPNALDGDCVRALEECGIASDQSYRDLQSLQQNLSLHQ